MKDQNEVVPSFNERGAAKLNLIILLVIVVLLAYAGFNYLPVYYEGVTMKEEMNSAVVGAMSRASIKPPQDVVRDEIFADLDERGVPHEALTAIQAEGTAVTATVSYSKSVPILPFGLYDYNYVFTYTAEPKNF